MSRHPFLPWSVRGRSGFTLVEVMVAAMVLIFGIVGALSSLQRGLQAVDSARNLTAATQRMQSEMESLRVKSWAQIEALQASGVTAVTLDDTRAGPRLTCTRTISDLKADMKEIVLTAEWRGYDGRPQSARLITRYGRSGLNDYFYTTH